MMTDKEIDAVEARVSAAMRGPWGVTGIATVACASAPHNVVAVCDSFATAAFMMHAREDVPALCAEVRRLRADRKACAAGADALARLAVVERDRAPDSLRADAAIWRALLSTTPPPADMAAAIRRTVLLEAADLCARIAADDAGEIGIVGAIRCEARLRALAEERS